MILFETQWTFMQYIDAANKISLVVIGIVNVTLAAYVLIFNRRKDRRDGFRAIQIMEQNMRLQWFRELIYSPNKGAIDILYNSLHSLKDKIPSNELTEDAKDELVTYVKSEASQFRKAFVDVLSMVDSKLHSDIKENIDILTDHLTTAILNDEFKLTNPKTYEKEINSKIVYSKNDLIAKVYNFKGET